MNIFLIFMFYVFYLNFLVLNCMNFWYILSQNIPFMNPFLKVQHVLATENTNSTIQY